MMSLFLIFVTETISRIINVELTSTFFTLQRFGPSPSPNFKQNVYFWHIDVFSKCKRYFSTWFQHDDITILNMMKNDDIPY